MSQQDDTPRLDRQADRMEAQEHRLENDIPPRSLGGGGGAATNLTSEQNTRLDLDRQADRMEEQERRLENDIPPESLDNTP